MFKLIKKYVVVFFFSVRIIDDDVDLRKGPNEGSKPQESDDDDAPTVAEIIDERPKHVQDLEAYRKNKQWKVLGAKQGDGKCSYGYTLFD